MSYLEFTVLLYLIISYSAQFDLLSNLIYILKKDKVENWMKKGWLRFEPNPNIAEINGIEPVELP